MSEKISKKELLDLLNNPAANAEFRKRIDELDEKALEGYQYLEDGSASEAISELSNRFDDWLPNQEISRSAKTIRISRLRLIRRVAAIALIILVPVFFLLRSPSSSQLAGQFFEAPRSPYMNLNRGSNAEIDEDLLAAFTLYEKKQYSDAAQALGDLASNYPDKTDLPYYQAISLLGAGEANEAIKILNLTSTQSNYDLDKKSPWFLGLAHLMNSDKDQAILWLEKAAAVDDDHAENAEALLKKIR